MGRGARTVRLLGLIGPAVPGPVLTGPVLVGASTDAVLGRVREELERRGHHAAVFDPQVYARLVSVTISGRRVLVEPDVPLLLRSVDPQTKTRETDRVSQALALAGALSASPVVNRPAPRLPPAPSSREIIEYLMGTERLDRSLFVEERRRDGGPMDRAAFEQEPLPDRNGREPGTAVRFRERMPPGWAYQKALVVGERCWLYHETLEASSEIRRLSLETASAAGLAFCCLYWRTAAAGRERAGPGRPDLQLGLARISAQPTEAELADLAGTAVSAVADLLLA